MKKTLTILLFFCITILFRCSDVFQDTIPEETEIQELNSSLDEDCIACVTLCPPGEICPPPPPPPPAGPLPARFQYFQRGFYSDRINTSLSASGTGNWSTEAAIAGSQVTSARADGALAPITFNGYTYVFYKGQQSHQEIYWARTSNGNTWTGNSVLGSNARTNNPPVATVLNDRIYVYHIGRSGSYIWVSISDRNDGTSYSANQAIQNLDGSIRVYPVSIDSNQGEQLAAVTFNNRIYIFYGRKDDTDEGKVWYISSSNGIQFTDPVLIDNFRTDEGISATVHNNQIYYTYVDISSNTIFVARTTNPGTRISGSVIRVNGTLARSLSTASIASDGSRLVVVYHSTGDIVHYAYSDDDGSTWNGNLPAQGQSRSSPSLVYTEN